ncbi:uncharacterized protein BJ171DRAFT_489696 [Polychytrium aggregatum]|uniref:uncharacterized protein n=1 Tax=Polychytrium aggregatum TaxID=110093 RepID=UPI0022FF136E|nr:uncharacterized protein BJ171DRAFT_489696 [Polychytrium aggregatum]KAI9208692.1 hypothetical protein BJ171DRAFT_489696 [Polychytrium aggregatum]
MAIVIVIVMAIAVTIAVTMGGRAHHSKAGQHGLHGLDLAWLGLAWLGLAWLGCGSESQNRFKSIGVARQAGR